MHPLVLLLVIAITFNCFESFGQITYTWNQTGTAAFTTPANWTPARTAPAANDKLVFNNAANTTVTLIPTQTIGQVTVSNNTTVNLQAAATNDVLTIGGGTGTDFSVAAGSALNINGVNAMHIILLTAATCNIAGNMSFSAAAHTIDAADASAITFSSPALFTQDIGCTGNIFTTAGTANAVVFGTGTTFVQNEGANPFGLTAPNSKLVFQTGSLFKIQKAPGLYLDRTFANLEINSPAFTLTYIGNGSLTTDNFTMTNGILSLDTDDGINIKGNLSVGASGVLVFNNIFAFPNVITFDGTAPQTISNAGTLTFGNSASIVINNAAGININSNITFKGLVTFTSGVVTIPSPNVLTLGAAASVAGVSNTSFADGQVAKIGNTAFTFPVGKTNCGPAGNVKGYAPLTIDNFTGGVATDKFTAEYKRGNSSSLGSITAPGLHHVSGCDYWTLTRDIGSSTVDITLSWNDPINNCGGQPYVDNRPSLTVAHNNNSGGSSWNTMAVAGVTSGTNAAGTVTWSGGQSTAFGAFAIGSIDFLNPLPVALNYFTGTRQSSRHLLNWKLSINGTEPLIITLERSADSRNFGSVYSITANATGNTQSFNYTDAQPLNGVNYYRLAMKDINGKITYSNLIALLNGDDGFVISNIAPNPISSNLCKLNITAARQLTAMLAITDATGRVVKTQTILLSAGFNVIDINTAGLSSGTYTIALVCDEYKPAIIRFIK